MKPLCLTPLYLDLGPEAAPLQCHRTAGHDGDHDAVVAGRVCTARTTPTNLDLRFRWNDEDEGTVSVSVTVDR